MEASPSLGRRGLRFAKTLGSAVGCRGLGSPGGGGIDTVIEVVTRCIEGFEVADDCRGVKGGARSSIGGTGCGELPSPTDFVTLTRGDSGGSDNFRIISFGIQASSLGPSTQEKKKTSTHTQSTVS